MIDRLLIWFDTISSKLGGWSLYLLQSILIFLSPIQGVLIAVGIAIFADTYFGIKVALKEGTYTTKSLRKGFASKTLSYQISIISFYIIDYFLLNEWMMAKMDIEYALTKLLGVLFIVFEASSINEKSAKLYKKSFYERIKETFKNIKSVKSEIENIK